ncbi:FtsB family cell division protein [Rhodococcoides kyotonense]|uniref:Cell division protein FtsL, interacts with FtsB, FtsL and FtsQ n=1 Tax=Rhodococcoides kyotonense TaxID=398843 RepID=A0A239ESQ6_9NOCA|nr:septum formation initiator family protein [Rhodococcus kyotonensis]SNS47053.1 Cell division protein FtsL, interacts with FtsB, FtsL and FtsQ [Rhodococcus kyotonensis]
MAARRGRPGTSPGGRDPRPPGRSSTARTRQTGAASGDQHSSGAAAPEPSDQARDAVVAGKAAPRRVGARASGKDRTFLGLSTGRAVVLAVVVCALALTLAMPLRTYFSQRAELSQVLADREGLQNDVRNLELEKSQLNEPARIAAEARTRLFWVMPGETPYTVQLPGDVAKSDAEEQATKQSEGPWYRDLWESAVQPQPSDEPETTPLPAIVPAPAPALEGGPVG